MATESCPHGSNYWKNCVREKRQHAHLAYRVKQNAVLPSSTSRPNSSHSELNIVSDTWLGCLDHYQISPICNQYQITHASQKIAHKVSLSDFV